MDTPPASPASLLEINADSDDYRALESDLEIGSDSASETAPNQPTVVTKASCTVKPVAVQQYKAPPAVSIPHNQANAITGQKSQAVSTTSTVKSSGIGDKTTESAELQALQALQALDSIGTPESNAEQPIPTQKVFIRPSRSRLPSELLNNTEKTTATVVQRDVSRWATEPFSVPTIVQRPRRVPSPQFARFNPALVSWSAQQAAVQTTTTIAPNVKKVVIHNYYGNESRPKFGNPLRLSRHQFKQYCRTVTKKTGDHWAQLRRQAKNTTHSGATSNLHSDK